MEVTCILNQGEIMIRELTISEVEDVSGGNATNSSSSDSTVRGYLSGMFTRGWSPSYSYTA